MGKVLAILAILRAWNVQQKMVLDEEKASSRTWCGFTLELASAFKLSLPNQRVVIEGRL